MAKFTLVALVALLRGSADRLARREQRRLPARWPLNHPKARRHVDGVKRKAVGRAGRFSVFVRAKAALLRAQCRFATSIRSRTMLPPRRPGAGACSRKSRMRRS